MPDQTAVPAHAEWLAAYRRSHDRVVEIASGLTQEQLASQSYDTEWSVAQVLSHLGSGAEIFHHVLDAGVAGAEVPGMDLMRSIWAVWDARSPLEMRDAFLAADAGFLEAIDSLSPEQAESFTVTLWAGPLDLAAFLQMRLAEHALHAWDVAVSFDPAATVADDAVGLLLPFMAVTASRSGTSQDPAYAVLLSTTDGHGDWVVTAGDPVSLTARSQGDVDGEVRLPAEALVRLVAGRLDPDHTPAGVVEAGARGLADLRAVFRGL